MRKLYGYICGTDDRDVSLGARDVILYPSVRVLKKERDCWRECGIYRVNLSELECVVEGTLWKKKRARR